MYAEWVAAEHHRLHIVDNWPEGPHKEAALNAIHSSLQSLLQTTGPDQTLAMCEVCLSQKKANIATENG